MIKPLDTIERVSAEAAAVNVSPVPLEQDRHVVEIDDLLREVLDGLGVTTLRHSGVDSLGCRRCSPATPGAINSVTCQRQMRKRPLPETGDWRLSGVLLGNLDSGCVPDVSLPTFQADGTR